MPPAFRTLGTGHIGPVPTPAVIALLVAVIGHIILERTRLGRGTLAIGGNEEAARLSGINVVLYKVAIYALAGVTYAVAATIVTARLNAAEPIAGMLAELDAIAAAVIGGTGLAGGVATVPGTVIGALIMAVLRNGLTLLSVQPYFQQLTIGVVIVAAVLLDQLRKR
jgi:ribose/xylose/arabinose/galactoside ABC-type transport system permease subunit